MCRLIVALNVHGYAKCIAIPHPSVPSLSVYLGRNDDPILSEIVSLLHERLLTCEYQLCGIEEALKS